MKRFMLLNLITMALLLRHEVWAQTNGARFVSQSVSQSMLPGERKTATVTMLNFGATWTQAGQYKLGTQSPQDNTLWIGGTRVYLAANESIVSGQTKTFSFEITAPATPGTYDFQWRMVQDGVGWFGDFTPLIKITVVGNPQPVVTFPVRPGLWPASDEESSNADIDADGLSQSRELQLAQAFFPTIWFDNGEDLSFPGGNYNHGFNQPGRLVFRVRPHPENPRYLAMTYAMLLARDGGETYGPLLGVAAHRGDVETFAITLAPNPLSKLGYGILSIRTWAHEGVKGIEKIETDTLYARPLYGFSVNPTGRDDVVLLSENKHGSYLNDKTCDQHLAYAENCDLDFTMGDVNAWVGFNAGEPNAPRHIDLGPLGFPGEQMWTKKRFTGGFPFPLYSGENGTGPIEEKFQLFAPAVHVATQARFVSQSVPPQMSAGETRTVSITMKNTGKLYWCPEIGIKLGSQNPQDNAIWTGDSRVQLPAGTFIQPGENYTFTFQITAPKTPGVYNFQWRMLQENVIWFGDFTSNVAIAVVPAAGYTLKASPATIAPNGQLTVSWTAPNGSSTKDWIGLSKVGSPNTSFSWWSYTNGAASGSFTVNAPGTPGQYEFRYFLNNGFTEAVRSNTVTVTGITPLQYTLTMSANQAVPNGLVTVNWTAPAGSSQKDWIGLSKVGSPNTSFFWWSYTNGAISGSFTVKVPSQPGDYEFRYFLNDGFTEAARSATVTVVASTNCWTEDFFDNLASGPLAGQNGWSAVTGSNAANVVVNPGGTGKVLQLDPPAGAQVFTTKSIGAALSGTQSLELKVRVEQPGSASMAKLEVNTVGGTFGGKKFQMYFGSSMRLNNSPTTALNFVAQTVAQRWYQIKVIFDLSSNLADLYVDGVLVLNDVAIGAGSVSGIAMTGFDAPGYVLVDDIRGCAGGLLKARASGHAEEAVATPSSFDLAQNYPNPFNPETSIQYAIPGDFTNPVRVTLRIYNLTGQVVRTLVDEQKSPGQHRVVWDGRNDLGAKIATGMYLYTITAGEFKATKRMTLMK